MLPRPPGARLARLNAWLSLRSPWVLAGLVVVNLVWPEPAVAIRQLRFGRIDALGWSYDFPTLALGLMMLSTSVQCRLADLVETSRQKVPGLAALALTYAVGPALAALWSALTLAPLGDDAAQQLQLGLFFVALMPVAMTAAMWVRVARGSLALALCLITLTTALSVATVPALLHIGPLVRSHAVSVPTSELAKQLVLSVTLPLLIGLTARHFVPVAVERLQPVLGLLGHLGLFAALSTNVAGASARLATNAGALVAAIGATVGFNILLLAVSYALARHLRTRGPGTSHEHAISLVLAGAMRSTGTGMVVGGAAFPTLPLVTVPAAIYSISQQVLAGLFVRAVARYEALLRVRLARGAKGVCAHVERSLRRRRPVVVLAFPPVPSASSTALAIRARARLRGYDYVSVLDDGGFAVVLPNVSERDGHRVAARIAGELAHTIPSVTTPWGLASHQDARTGADLLRFAVQDISAWESRVSRSAASSLRGVLPG